MPTKIEWCAETWNPIVGCSKISPGCDNCYAEKMARRLAGMGQEKYKGVICGDGWTGDCKFSIDEFKKPFSWKKGRMIFVCSMGDIFHKNVPFEWVDHVIATVISAPQHKYLILTKRPEIMQKYFEELYAYKRDIIRAAKRILDLLRPLHLPLPLFSLMDNLYNPIENLWLGVTGENQKEFNRRVPILLEIPTAIRYVSIEPMLGPVEAGSALGDEWSSLEEKYRILPYKTKLDWVILGGETGPGARKLKPGYVREIREQCEDSSTPFFFKSWGGKDKSGIIFGEECKEYPK